MSSLKILVQGIDRKTIITLIKAERRNIEINANNPVATAAQRRAVDFYEEHLLKLQKRINPADKWANKR